MSNAKYPTWQQVLPFYNFLLKSINRFLGCKNSNERPNLRTLEIEKGVPQEIGRAALVARSKLLKYYNMISLSSLYLIATGKD